MNKEELKELGKTLIGISEGESWQFRKPESLPDSQWVDAGMMADPARILKDGGKIRLKPWELGKSINGHTLPPGAYWHRQDWTEDMLPPPYRPLTLGETGEYEFLYSPGKWLAGSTPSHPASSGHEHNRTIRPIPLTLTPEQIADGWVPWNGGECPVEPESRPTVMYRNGDTESSVPARTWIWGRIDGEPYEIIAYRPDPYGKLRQALAGGKTVEYQPSVGSQWLPLGRKEQIGFVAPPEAYRIKEPRWLPLGPEDVQPGSVFRQAETTKSCPWYSALCVNDLGVRFHAGGNNEFTLTYVDLERLPWEINRSLSAGKWDPAAWEPCRKEAKPATVISHSDIVAEQQEAEASHDHNSGSLQTVAN